MLRSTARRCNCLMNILSGHVREIVLLLFPRSTRTEPLISLSFNRKMPLKRFYTGWWKKNTHRSEERRVGKEWRWWRWRYREEHRTGVGCRQERPTGQTR